MKIGIDARFLSHPQRGGFKTYSEQLIAALTRLDQRNAYVLYLDRPPVAQVALPRQANVTLRIIDGQAPLVGMPWREQVGLAYAASRDQLDLLHAPCLTAPLLLTCPLVVTIHDMIWQRTMPARIPMNIRSLMDYYYQLVTNLAVRQAAAVITVSHAARTEIINAFGLSAEQVIVTHEAAKPMFQQPIDPSSAAAIRARFKLDRPYVLAIGSSDPRKNLATLLRSYAALPDEQRSSHQLAIVWTHQHLANEIAQLAQDLGIAEHMVFLQHVEDHELAALYAGATLFAFPSRYEGFGLPLLEAMAGGTPVVAADNSSLPEIVGDAALLTPTDDVAALATAMSRLIADRNLRADLISRGQRRAASFTWRRCAEETLAVYEQVGSLHSRGLTKPTNSRGEQPQA